METERTLGEHRVKAPLLMAERRDELGRGRLIAASRTDERVTARVPVVFTRLRNKE